MRKLILKEITIISHSTKSARQFELGRNLTLITANDGNSVGKSTLAKMIFWSFGCEPIFSKFWKQLDCSSIITFSIDDVLYSLHRYKNEMSLREPGQLLKIYDKVTGAFSEKFATLVGFDVLLPKKDSFNLEVPPPAYYFLPFYIDQKRTWVKPWDSFDNLQQYSRWAQPVISFHSGLISKEHFVVEEDIYEAKAQVNEVQNNINELNNAVTILKKNIDQHDYNVDSESVVNDVIKFEEMIKNNLEQTSELKIDLIEIKSQIKLAESIIIELDKDYVFSVENMNEGSVECPTCGTIHENSIAHRSSILIDKEAAEKQLALLLQEQSQLQMKLSQMFDELSSLKEKLLNAQLSFESSNSKLYSELATNNVDKQVSGIVGKKSIVLADTQLKEEKLKKRQKDLTTKKERDSIKKNFSDTFFKYVTKLRVNIDASHIKSPLDYKKIYEVGGAAEDARAVLGYYLALYDHISNNCQEVVPPLVIDTPNQQEQSSENYSKIVDAITRGVNDNNQYIICAMQHDALEELSKNAKIIRLDETKILSPTEYQQLSKVEKEMLFI
ncbi:TPA: hypothetical protein OB599_001530 [Escherichia coli]|uniref:hypothetical protein n=1 Tax=Escherichia coli TaxID=562 RepID=UPI001C709904|nr:hypothetical protein [Escherichia coli]ELT6554775.1 hypothetical protein [Escherichia coli]MBW9437165.1 hypothetical protein [Escherichia coli]HCO7507121.1 hypothetical protein [Escherichia coli]